MLKIYNTYTQQKEVLNTITPQHVNMYVCGVTVYDYCHLGHLRMLINFDLIVRVFQLFNYTVCYVRNITDIDDKIIERANKAGEDWRALTERYIQYMNEDLAPFNLLPPTQQPRATEHIGAMIELITTLLAANKAYISDNSDVFFAVRSFPEYGKLAKRSVEQLMLGSRIEVNTAKRDPEDFVLWKAAKPHEPSWPAPWGGGRPGWHIECSAMAAHYLGMPFDVHGGGSDLIFPHHENEIAQSEAASCHKFANYWVHNGHIMVGDDKMSKSKHNFITVRELLALYDSETIRYFIIASHYRSPISFSTTAMVQARQGLERCYLALRGLPSVALPSSLLDSKYYHGFCAALADDCNTPEALAQVFAVVQEVCTLRQQGLLTQAAEYGALLRHIGAILGLLQEDPEQFLQHNPHNIDLSLVNNLVKERDVARGQHNWAEADRIRDVLLSIGVVLEDHKGGTKWRIQQT